MPTEKEKVDILKEDAEKLAKFAVENKINKERMAKLAKEAFEEFKKKHKSNFKYKYHIIITIISIIVAIFYTNPQLFDLFYALTRIFIIKQIFPWIDLSILSDDCLITNHHYNKQPEKEFLCGVCPDVVDKIWKIDSQSFKEELIGKKQPLMVIGASTQWKATNLFTLPFLADLYNTNDVLRSSPPCTIYLNLKQHNNNVDQQKEDNDDDDKQTENNDYDEDEQQNNDKNNEDEQHDNDIYPHQNNNTQHSNNFKTVNDLLAYLKENLKPEDPAWVATWETCKPESYRVLRKFYKRPPRFIEGTQSHWIILSSNKQHHKFTNIETGTEVAWYTHMRGCEESKVVLEDKLCQCPDLYATLHPGDLLYWPNDRWSFSMMTHPHGDVRAICFGVLFGGFYQ